MNKTLFLLTALFFSAILSSPLYAQKVSHGYGGVELGMTIEQTKNKLKENSDSVRNTEILFHFLLKNRFGKTKIIQ